MSELRERKTANKGQAVAADASRAASLPRRAKETGPPVEPSTLDRIQTVFTYGLLVSLVAIVITVVVMYPSAMGLLEASGIYPARTVQNTANAENCRKRGRELGLSCEDIVLHHPSGVAFLACDNLEARQKYWPPIERWDTKFAGTGKIFMMDLKVTRSTEGILAACIDVEIRDIHRINFHFTTQKTSAEKLVALDLANFKGKLTTGGLGIWWDEADRDLVILNLVNHAPGGSTIEIFEHRLGSNMAIHLETVDASKGALNAPNNVQPVGRGSFYATNDHKFHKGVMRIVEEMFLTRWSHVVFRDEHTKQVRVVADGIAIANGIAISAEQSRIYVSSSLGHKIHVYERRPNNGLRLIEAVNLKFLAENLFVDPTTGAVLVTGHPRGLDLLNHMVNHKLKSATWIVKVTNNTDSDQFFGKNYKDDLVFSELGKHISGGTATVVDHTTGKTAIVGPFSEGVLVCGYLL
ncbi:Serum paraoxonase/arylesterase 2 [Irineochytrium annulatum]|nr:Serum paraoxonase/arylesterase 2 [Irineochytrium annulatum]